ncbi:cytosine permease [Bacillus salipaludis]|uniref:cytosine permease n=1 Tax=Bacillus salipaludis TaxID=2547811 RepID=UPI002E2284F6|nr:cytosine permease [Bacillus salipaludis]
MIWNETVFKKIAKRQLNIKELYSNSGQYYYKNGFHIPALIATLVAGFVSLIGQFVPALKPLYDLSFFTGMIFAFSIYTALVHNGLFTTIKGQQQEVIEKGA